MTSTLRRLLAAAALAGAPLGAQEDEPDLPPLPERTDTLTATSNGVVVGRGVLEWTRRGLDQLQVYTWTSAFTGERIIDSLTSYPLTLRSVRAVQVTGDTARAIIFGRDTIWITTTVGDVSQTARAAAPAVTLRSSASLMMLAATMPFAVGARRVALVYFAPSSDLGARYVPIVVEGAESVDGRSAWRIMAGTPRGSTTFWVDARTRALLRFDAREGDTTIRFSR